MCVMINIKMINLKFQKQKKIDRNLWISMIQHLMTRGAKFFINKVVAFLTLALMMMIVDVKVGIVTTTSLVFTKYLFGFFKTQNVV